MAWHHWKCEWKQSFEFRMRMGNAKAKMCTKYQNEEEWMFIMVTMVWKDASIERKPINTRRTFTQFFSINRQRSGTNSIKVNNFNINACLCLYVNEVVDCRHMRFHNIFIIIVYKGFLTRFGYFFLFFSSLFSFFPPSPHSPTLYQPSKRRGRDWSSEMMLNRERIRFFFHSLAIIGEKKIEIPLTLETIEYKCVRVNVFLDSYLHQMNANDINIYIYIHRCRDNDSFFYFI